MGKSSAPVVGYKYLVLYHAGLTIGPIDAFLEFRAGDNTAWSGELTASGTININAPNLFGGDQDQGGIVSDADVMFGEADQAPNAYLLDNLGDQVPGWRGLATFVLKGGEYGAMNPYPQKPAYKFRKIKKGWDNDTCWYPEKAEVPLSADTTLAIDAGGWEYQIIAYHDNPGYANLDIPTDGWEEDGQGPFSSNTGDTPAGNVTWPQDTILWARRSVTVSTGGAQTLTVIVENGCVVFINGAIAGAVDRDNVQIDSNENNTFTFPVQAGQTYDIAIKAFDEHPTLGGTFLSIGIAAPGLTAMNPAHILYYLRTSSLHGREPIASMNDASWRAAADWYYAQGVGFCTGRDPATESVQQSIDRICAVAGCGVDRSPVDGQWYIDVINGVYDLDSLPILSDDDILDFSETPSVMDSATNSMTVEYFDPQIKDTRTTPPVQALALIDAFGTIPDSRTFHELATGDLAVRFATRELQNLVTPGRAFEITCTRKPYSWRRNTYFRLQSPKRGIADMVCILAGTQTGTLKSGAIKITAAQDIFSLPSASFVDMEPGVDTRPPQIPLGIMQQAVLEAPYIEVVRNLSRADLAALPNDVGFLMTVAKDPNVSRDYSIIVSTDGGSSYADNNAHGPWCPNALIVEGDALTDAAPATDFTLASDVLLANVSIGSAALWENSDGTYEIVSVDVLDAVAGTITLGRGCADTPPGVHAANARIWFYDDFAGELTTEFTDGEAIDVALLTNTGTRQLDPSLATPLALTFNQRQFRPYPPANVKINGEWYPSEVTAPVSVSFGERNRVTQADQLVDYSEATVAAEAGTTYTVRGYLDGALDATLSARSGSPIAWTPAGTGTGRVELVAVRDAVESSIWQHTFTITGVVSMTTKPTSSVGDSAARISFRASAASDVAIKYSTSADLSGATTTAAVSVDDTTDFAGAVDVTGLDADTVYYYTPVSDGEDQYTATPYPTFKTFPAAGAPASFSFAFGSCTKHSGMPTDSIFGQVPAGVRFLMHLGDTIYADSDTPAAVTLDDYRGKHRGVLAGLDTSDAGYAALRASMPVFVMWDDHDITNDFSGGTSDPLYAPAKQAFQEYQGRANPDSLTSGELYYTFQYGDVGFFVCDLRSFRSANTATDDASKTILGATQKAALKDWLLTNKTTLKFKFICASVPAHGYASNTAGDSWGGIDDGTQAPDAANGFRTERNEIWDYIDTNQIPGVLIISGDQHWAGSFKTTYAARPRYEFQATPFNSPVLTEDSRAVDAVNGPIFWKYDAGMNVGVVSIDTTVSPPTVSFQLYGLSGSLGASYLTSLTTDDINLDLVPVPAIEITTDLPAATIGVAYTGSVTATNVGGATGAITLTDDALPAGLSLGARTGSGDGPYTWPVEGTATSAGDDELVTAFHATNGTQEATLDYTWDVSTADPDWADVVSLLHFEGANDSTTFTDETGLVWAAVGNAQISTAASKFGTASLTLDGTGDYIDRVIATPGFAVGTGDFTVEAFANINASNDFVLFSTSTTAGSPGFMLRLRVAADSNFMRFSDFVANVGFNSTSAVPTGVWAHVALTRASGTCRFFINGVQAGSFACASNFTANAANAIGGNTLVSTSKGNIDEFRFTSGVARYTSNFTPPAAPFANHA